jgi:hypothetical protein
VGEGGIHSSHQAQERVKLFEEANEATNGTQTHTVIAILQAGIADRKVDVVFLGTAELVIGKRAGSRARDMVTGRSEVGAEEGWDVEEGVTVLRTKQAAGSYAPGVRKEAVRLFPDKAGCCFEPERRREVARRRSPGEKGDRVEERERNPLRWPERRGRESRREKDDRGRVGARR